MRKYMMIYTEQEKNAVVHPPSDDSEPISVEVQVNMPKKARKLLYEPLKPGYTIDDEGNFNIYAVEPKMYKAEYPSIKQQQRYLFLGATAVLFVSFLMWIAFAAS
jgi:hypothetical protein